MQTKKQVFESPEEADKFYEKSGFMVNKALSMHMDCIMPINMLNYYWSLDGSMKHDFLMAYIRGYKRKFNYAKAEKISSAIGAIKEYYQCSNAKAKEYLSILNNEQIDEITKRLSKGGRT